MTGVSGTAASLEGVSPTLTYYVGSTPSSNGSSTAPNTVGTYTVVATFAGSTDYTSASNSKTFTITQATPTVNVTDAGGVYTGSTYPATATVTGVSGTATASLEGVSLDAHVLCRQHAQRQRFVNGPQHRGHVYGRGRVRREHRLHVGQQFEDLHDHDQPAADD